MKIRELAVKLDNVFTILFNNFFEEWIECEIAYGRNITFDGESMLSQESLRRYFVNSGLEATSDSAFDNTQKVDYEVYKPIKDVCELFIKNDSIIDNQTEYLIDFYLDQIN